MATRRGSEKLLGQHMGHSALNCVKVRAHRKRSVKLREIALNFQSVNSPKKHFKSPQVMVGAPPTAAKSRGVTMFPPLHFSGPFIFWWNHPRISCCTEIFNKFTQEPIHCCPSDSAVHRHGRPLRWNPSVQMTRWPRSENVWVSSLVVAWPLAIN